ncbi:FKBP-type peptidyl-prolyl cis-trans isomerase [Parendozoicomonas haliclonae]|uniref:Peptidyl-prolyl cis-trans isomerase n=1 Tax=Parendozoicomonas haliclonae TaxID=1960125 RepID=A0A1X7AHL3_9GAMM|nr:FKBP-type peptidyl-prolyl cis-trans isomerase [Parendozoicomonas haliclonae]SMA43085.1 FKBP-type 22 kDa peptidyl-prolyl cis-trans isomerase [Parendozoicomonas haliclonae]
MTVHAFDEQVFGLPENRFSVVIGVPIHIDERTMLDKYFPYIIAAVCIVGFLIYQQRQNTAHAAEVGPRVEQEQAWMAENKNKDGVKTTDSGLQYLILNEGDGQTYPSAKDKVRVHYQGTLINGTEFDSSYRRGEPISFGLNQVIAGWTEGLQLMSVGSKARLFIPPELAYGARAMGKIPAHSTLVFEVELLGIE